MNNQNKDGVYPSIMLHLSSQKQLVIGAQMMAVVTSDEYAEKRYSAYPASNASWQTRFDGGGRHDIETTQVVVSMVTEGQRRLWSGGYDEDCGEEMIVRPLCYAIVTVNVKKKVDWAGKTVHEAQNSFLRSHFNFERILHDGVYDLKDAFEKVEGNKNHNPSRKWWIVAKKDVPSRIRQLLHRAVKRVKETVDLNFGQGGSMFKLPRKK